MLKIQLNLKEGISMKNKKEKLKNATMQNIHRKIFATQLVLILSLALFLGVAGTLINIKFETIKRDQNLQNIAETIAQSPLLDEKINEPDNMAHSEMLSEYLDSLKNTLDNIDVISIVGKDNSRLYHSNHELIGTMYDGTMPEFEKNTQEYYATYDSGPSGTQRRAYAAVYDNEGNYTGFVMAIMLMENVKSETFQIFLIFALITIAAILFELFISSELSRSIKRSLHGYEPNVFSAMYQIRDNILESLTEGVLAVDDNGIIQFANKSAVSMLLGIKDTKKVVGKPLADVCNDNFLSKTLEKGETEFNIQEHSLKNADVLIDSIPIKNEDSIIGAVAILHNRAEYTKLMEDLAGTRYLVDSMRANNHDFTNKLHVILGLIQMEMYNEAISYIENISIVQRETISKIMSVVDEPAIAALLIGKSARASELNIKFVLHEESHYSKADYPLPSELLVTVIGNLIENAYEAMNFRDKDYKKQNELRFGIFSRPDALLLTVSDTGIGISNKNKEHIFDNGFSTKGDGRGTGLYQVKEMIDAIGGKITVESQENVGTSFTISISKEV